MSNTHRPLTRLAPALVAVPLALTLAACGGTDDDATATSGATTSATPSTPSTPSTPAETPSGSGTEGTSQAAAGGADAQALTAAATAQSKVAGSRVFSVEREAGGWEVHVATDNGTESELRISADGSSVTRGPITDAQDDANDGDDNDGDDRNDLARDRAENERLLGAAKVDHEAAVQAARAAVPSGELGSMDLDFERGDARWEVTFGDNTPDEQTVTVDAASGKVLGTQRDD